jgi:dTDP-4-dehydrorhamnose 3,5-epimerase
MDFRPTPIDGVVVVSSAAATDGRGAFVRLFDCDEFDAAGLASSFPQHSRSDNLRAGTLRGLHLQRSPHAEAKLVRCLRGRLWDVAADVRPDSPTFGCWFGIELSGDGRDGLYLPQGVAHGFVTLEDDTSLLYLISTPYVAEASVGIRWDDPTLGIDWPIEPAVLSDRDRSLPLLIV